MHMQPSSLLLTPTLTLTLTLTLTAEEGGAMQMHPSSRPHAPLTLSPPSFRCNLP